VRPASFAAERHNPHAALAPAAPRPPSALTLPLLTFGALSPVRRALAATSLLLLPLL